MVLSLDCCDHATEATIKSETPIAWYADEHVISDSISERNFETQATCRHLK
jgi:hypothetical protein